MKPPRFEYVRAASLDEALEVLGAQPDEAKPLAGGQSLVPMLNLRLARPELLVDLNDLELDEIGSEDGMLCTGALVRHHQLLDDPVIVGELPLVARAARYVGHPAIRNRGTLGGSLAHADPTAELALAALALDARAEIASIRGSRQVDAGELFVGAYTTALEPDELIVRIRWPRAGGDDRFGFHEVAERDGDFALAAAACRLRVRAGRVETARVAVAGATPAPQLLDELEHTLVGEPVDAALPARAAAACPRLAGRSDVHARGEFRAELVRVVVERAVREAVTGSAAA